MDKLDIEAAQMGLNSRSFMSLPEHFFFGSTALHHDSTDHQAWLDDFARSPLSGLPDSQRASLHHEHRHHCVLAAARAEGLSTIVLVPSPTVTPARPARWFRPVPQAQVRTCAPMVCEVLTTEFVDLAAGTWTALAVAHELSERLETPALDALNPIAALVLDLVRAEALESRQVNFERLAALHERATTLKALASSQLELLTRAHDVASHAHSQTALEAFDADIDARMGAATSLSLGVESALSDRRDMLAARLTALEELL